jgi:hypothetical protein
VWLVPTTTMPVRCNWLGLEPSMRGLGVACPYHNHPSSMQLAWALTFDARFGCGSYLVPQLALFDATELGSNLRCEVWVWLVLTTTMPVRCNWLGLEPSMRGLGVEPGTTTRFVRCDRVWLCGSWLPQLAAVPTSKLWKAGRLSSKRFDRELADTCRMLRTPDGANKIAIRVITEIEFISTRIITTRIRFQCRRYEYVGIVEPQRCNL